MRWWGSGVLAAMARQASQKAAVDTSTLHTSRKVEGLPEAWLVHQRPLPVALGPPPPRAAPLPPGPAQGWRVMKKAWCSMSPPKKG